MSANNTPVSDLLGISIEKIKEMADVNSIIGEPIKLPDGTTIIPVSKVSYGFASGGSDLPTKKDNRECFGGGSGAGVTINPIGFLSISKGNVKFVPVEKYDGAADRIVAMVPETIDKISSFFNKNKKAEEKSDLDNDLGDFDM